MSDRMWLVEYQARRDARVRRQVVGDIWVSEDEITKESKSKNVITQRIIRRTKRHIVLDCGHNISVAKFNKVPTKNTFCSQCGDEIYEASQESSHE